MEFAFEEDVLIAQAGYEKIRIEAWGRDALRVRATLNANFSGAEKGLGEPPAQQAECGLFECGAYIRNGKLRCEVHHNGYLTFFEGERVLLKEYYRDFSWANEHSPSMKLRAREYRSHGTDYEITLRFEAREEKLFGMGQYQQPIFDLKGCVLELAQRTAFCSIIPGSGRRCSAAISRNGGRSARMRSIIGWLRVLPRKFWKGIPK